MKIAPPLSAKLLMKLLVPWKLSAVLLTVTMAPPSDTKLSNCCAKCAIGGGAIFTSDNIVLNLSG